MSKLVILLDVKGFGWFKAALRIFPLLGVFRKYGRMSTGEFAERFKDPFLKEVFASLFNIPDFPVIGMISTLGWMHAKTAGYPVGGSLAFVKAIEERYGGLGGRLHYKSKVIQILVENDTAVGGPFGGRQRTPRRPGDLRRRRARRYF